MHIHEHFDASLFQTLHATEDEPTVAAGIRDKTAAHHFSDCEAGTRSGSYRDAEPRLPDAQALDLDACRAFRMVPSVRPAAGVA